MQNVRLQKSYVRKSCARAIITALLLCEAVLSAQTVTVHDPGPRPGVPAAGAGKPIPGLPADQVTFWVDGLRIFGKIASVSGTLAGEPLSGLGPAFNGNSCFQCHSQPAIGGTSPASNPQIPLANLDGAVNVIPSFLSPTGPILEARFLSNADGSPDGSVHELFTITGRADSPVGCNLAQPDFATQLAQNNVAFRIPIPTFGEGFVENTPDQILLTNLAANGPLKTQLGISGHFNSNPNDGTITRFGWKAQNKSMLLFAGEASNVEMGITNELFTNEKVTSPGCQSNATPEDNTHVIIPPGPTAGDAASQISSLIENFTIFMRLNAAPVPCDFASPTGSCNALSASARNGKVLFGTILSSPGGTPNTGIGCVLCHTDSLITGSSTLSPLNGTSFQPFSDFALHHMGATVADGVSQGRAGPDEFRTAPLWGVGQRLFFLHDGRANDLVTAIQAHADPDKCKTKPKKGQFCSEANGVIDNFSALPVSAQQDLLNFLRSL